MMIILLTLTSSFLIQLGYFIWKISLNELPRVGKDKVRVVLVGFLTNPKWLLGMFLRLFGLALFIKATHIGAISLVQPLMSIGDLFVVLLAYIFLHERLVKLEWVGMGVIIAGAAMIACEAKIAETTTIDWVHIICFILIAACVLISLVFLGMRTRFTEIFLGIAVGVEFGISSILAKAMTSSLALSGHPVNVMSCVLNPIFPVILISNITGLVILQMAFQNGRASVVLPIQLSVVNGVAVLGGVFLFSENVSMFRVGGVILIFLGTFLMQYAKDGKQGFLNRKQPA